MVQNYFGKSVQVHGIENDASDIVPIHCTPSSGQENAIITDHVIVDECRAAIPDAKILDNTSETIKASVTWNSKKN